MTLSDSKSNNIESRLKDTLKLTCLEIYEKMQEFTTTITIYEADNQKVEVEGVVAKWITKRAGEKKEGIFEQDKGFLYPSARLCDMKTVLVN